MGFDEDGDAAQDGETDDKDGEPEVDRVEEGKRGRVDVGGHRGVGVRPRHVGGGEESKVDEDDGLGGAVEGAHEAGADEELAPG